MGARLTMSAAGRGTLAPRGRPKVRVRDRVRMRVRVRMGLKRGGWGLVGVGFLLLSPNYKVLFFILKIIEIPKKSGNF